MKVNFGQVIVNTFTGQPQTISVAENDVRELTLGIACANVLYTRLQGDNVLAPLKVLEYKRLAERVLDGDIVEITHKEAAMLQERLAAGYPVAICGQAIEMLEDGNPKGADK